MYLIFNIEGYFSGIVNNKSNLDPDEFFIFEVRGLRDLVTIVEELKKICPHYLNDSFY